MFIAMSAILFQSEVNMRSGNKSALLRRWDSVTEMTRIQPLMQRWSLKWPAAKFVYR